MATWKKLVTSGSGVSQLNNDSNYIVSGDTVAELTGSFTGSFTGDGSGLTGIPASSVGIANLIDGAGINDFTYNGQSAASISVDTAFLAGNGLQSSGGKFIVKPADTTINVTSAGIKVVEASLSGIPNSALTNSSLTLGSTSISLGATAATIAGLKLTGVVATGSFTGSFIGDGSGLTGIASTLGISGSSGIGSIDLQTQDLNILGTTNEITTVASGDTITVSLPDNITVGNNLIVSNNLTVLGTASFQETENLSVADRFVLFASGSNTTGDGGIVVQQATQNVGELFGFDSSTSRWSVTSSFDSATSAFTPDAFMSMVVVGSASDPSAAPTRYVNKGNIFVSANGDIHIYS